MHRMTLAEAQSYLAGQDRRARQSWEQTRVLGGLVHKVLTGEEWSIEFPWDEPDNIDVTTPEYVERMRAMARHMEEVFNAKR